VKPRREKEEKKQCVWEKRLPGKKTKLTTQKKNLPREKLQQGKRSHRLTGRGHAYGRGPTFCCFLKKKKTEFPTPSKKKGGIEGGRFSENKSKTTSSQQEEKGKKNSLTIRRKKNPPKRRKKGHHGKGGEGIG